MRNGLASTGALVAAAAFLWLSSPTFLVAQSESGAVAEPALPTPRLEDGTVDLGGEGYWNLYSIHNLASLDNLSRRARGTPYGSEPPMKPWTEAMYRYHQERGVRFDPEGFCLPPGGPRAFATPFPMEIIQQPERDRIIIIFEGGAHVWRVIYMDGRPHPEGEALNPTYFGHSVGHWEGDTLIIDTVGYNEKTWIDYEGHMHTDQLRTIERITRLDYLTLRYEATFIDPGAYTEPWTTSWDIPFSPGGEIREYICQENNRWLIDLKDDFGQPFFSSDH